jgi:hypothetical protein
VIERFLIAHYGGEFTSRLVVAACVRAISVLIREHPLIAARLLGAGLARAAQVGVNDLYEVVRQRDNDSSAEPAAGVRPPSVPLIGTSANFREE